ncbi:actin binding protein, putative [Entamoeba histolytica HM-1:IMSS-B]|uniref:Actin binding protein, putative n=6 Tax=Entamoeba histolytica TaxID=5759 RepID=C4LVI9_ENTH1|nr:actin binding protein, putative [Entamoeba histolytica HM-1:IMSS]EMD48722.1 actin binding protein, putative [Entamoeba histolytica KU27]EMH76989.1 actin binding protein, putative [Entamoeba histolytica HM-1:IMSS-B]ENY64836.1 actin binding protein, putative [Entamoeba histolytica HM-1:IMSS-A]GAT92686.1 actin binding protein putative [Entamoeba histolytica]EAL47033.1 actin binding protein, putative [Entamoeba histolytica HM-1:IMSS]|eukprot:XP_652419.1 actin binding protein, putative [Entamoeba histolytica HM-1:IMSS]
MSQTKKEEFTNFSLSKHKDVDKLSEQIKSFLLDHDLSLEVKLKPKRLPSDDYQIINVHNGFINKQNTFSIVSKEQDETVKLEVEITNFRKEKVEFEIIQNGLFEHKVFFTPKVIGEHLIIVSVDGYSLPPISLIIEDVIDISQCWIDGKIKEGGLLQAEKAIGQLHMIGESGSPFEGECTTTISCFTPNNKEIKGQVKKGEHGIYTLECEINKRGTYTFDIWINNKRIKALLFNTHFILPICPSKCLISGKGMEEIKTIKMTKIVEFTIQTKDKNGDCLLEGGNEFNIHITDPKNQVIPCECIDNKDGTYVCKYTPSCSGKYQIEVQYQTKPLAKSPYLIIIEDEYEEESAQCCLKVHLIIALVICILAMIYKVNHPKMMCLE